MEGELQQVFGRNVRRCRQDAGLSQESFAEELGVHRTFLGSLERGERNLTLRTVERLSERIGVPPVELMTP